MGRMRSALRSYALEFQDTAVVLRKLDQKMQYFEGEVMATVSYAVLDPASGQVRISAAGHFPPVVAAPGGRGVLAEIAVDAPIGVADAPDRQVTTLALVPGAVLCFFTDGLVERRNKPLDDGIALLCETVSPGRPQTVRLSVMRALVGSEHPGDDIALLVLALATRSPATDPVSLGPAVLSGTNGHVHGSGRPPSRSSDATRVYSVGGAAPAGTIRVPSG